MNINRTKGNNMTIIHKGVKMPASRIPGRRRENVLYEMDVGDMVEVPTLGKASYILAYGKKLGKKFVSRKTGDIYRVWRVE